MSSSLLPDGLRCAISERLYQSLGEFMAPSVAHAAAINTIGCYLLCHVTGEEYEVVAGSLTVRQGGAPLVLRADPARVDEHEYYVWIERCHADGRVELIDFAAPCWQDWAREAQVLWLGPKPEVVWTFVDELADAIARYTPHAEITNMVRVALHNAFRASEPPQQVARWESAINRTIDRLTDDPRAIGFLLQTGVAEQTAPPH
jgi:hypothetical protein